MKKTIVALTLLALSSLAWSQAEIEIAGVEYLEVAEEIYLRSEQSTKQCEIVILVDMRDKANRKRAKVKKVMSGSLVLEVFEAEKS
jgi:hypothetical protein